MGKQGTNPRPAGSRPKHPGITYINEVPEESLKRVHKTVMEVFNVISNNRIDSDEFEIIVLTLRNEFRKLNGNRNFKFETELKAVSREEVKRKFREILNSKDIL